jgi:glucose-6-phosphate 1-dehydrogenase
MSAARSDALVLFGITGDLAYKKIFPALQAMVKRGHLGVPIIGVAKAGWTLEQLRVRARDSVERHGGLDVDAFATLNGLLRYVDGDYREAATFQAIRQQLGTAKRPAYYLAIPPTLFPLVVDQLHTSGCTMGARVIVEKPFGRDLVSAQALNRTLFGCFDESTIFRIDHYLGKRPVHHMLFFRFANAFMEPFWDRNPCRDVCRVAPLDRFVALAGRPLLHQGGQASPCDVHGSCRATPTAAHAVSRDQRRAKLLPVSDQSRHHVCHRRERHRAGR